MFRHDLKQTDSRIDEIVSREYQRQEEGLELIPSENYASKAVLQALGSVFTNKYAEGYPGKRYYGGQENTDQLEALAIQRAKLLFGCDHANVQPLSGAPANMGVYFAWLEPGDTVLGMDLTHGGHLTHGHPVTHAAKLFNFVRYRMKDTETGEIDFDELREIAKKEKPKIILAGFTCYPRELDYARFKEIADEVGAIAMADIAHIAGLIAARVLKNPFDYDFQVVSTTTHKTLRGPRGGMILTKGKVGNPLKKVSKTIENLPTLIDRSIFPGMQGGPHMNKIAALAVTLQEAAQPSFIDYAKQILKNAQAMADEFMKQGVKLVTNGTDNHLMLIDCKATWGITGDVVESTLDKIGITLNKNTIPDDPEPAFRPSGVRLGTPALTTRGLKEEHSRQVARWMVQAVEKREDESAISSLRQEVKSLCQSKPIYG